MTSRRSDAVVETVIDVDTVAPGTAISPDLFGVFFEDLSHAADGGLYAELLQNRSFARRPGGRVLGQPPHLCRQDDLGRTASAGLTVPASATVAGSEELRQPCPAPCPVAQTATICHSWLEPPSVDHWMMRVPSAVAPFSASAHRPLLTLTRR